MTSCCPDDVMLPYRNSHPVTSRPAPFTVDGRQLETSPLHRRWVDTLWWPRRIIVALLIIYIAMERCHDAMCDAMRDEIFASLHRTVTLRIAPSLSEPTLQYVHALNVDAFEISIHCPRIFARAMSDVTMRWKVVRMRC